MQQDKSMTWMKHEAPNLTLLSLIAHIEHSFPIYKQIWKYNLHSVYVKTARPQIPYPDSSI